MEMRTHHPSKRGSMEEEDRLSSLPDDLLHSILRELPLKHAARKSALSRRWAPQWLRALPSFRVLDFTGGQPPARATVRRCLELHAERGAPLDVFRVALTSPPAGSSDGAFGRDVAGWIASAVARGAREVEVDLAPTKGDDADDGRSTAFVELPGDLFAAMNSLARLALGGFSLRAVLGAAPAGLAGLRSLSLSHADVTHGALGDVVSSCRALESLSLSSCNLLKQVRIASETLRVLEIVRCPAIREVEVDTPALESFAFHGDSLYVRDDDDDGRGFLSSGINLGSQSTPALRDVYLSHIGIDFDDDERELQDGDEREFAYGRLLIRVDHAQVWTLCSVGLRYLGWCEQRPVETNVQELQLLMASVVVDDEEELQFISNLFYLFRFPLLDRLFIRFPGHATDASDADAAAALAREVVAVSKSKIYEADFVLDSLRFIKLVNLRGTRFEVQLLAFLLSSAPALELSPGLLQAIVDGIMELNYLLKKISSHLEKIFFYLALVPL